MGFMDKLKNIFFEEDDDDEEIEEPVSPKKEKNKEKEKKVEKEEKKEKLKEVIARKVELPKIEKKERNETEEIDFSGIELDGEEKVKEEIKVVKKEVIEKPKEEVKIKKEPKINQELIFDDEDFILDTKPKVKREDLVNKVKKEDTNLYRGKDIKKEITKDIKKDYPKTTYNIKKEEVKAKTFTPSPIISPIYGILDKNYKKEEVKDNKEIRISSRPSRMDLDSVRNKAFGDLEYDLNLMDDNKKEEVRESKKNDEKKSKEDIKKIYSRKNTDDDKPSIERVTIGEADEYYNDLGLAYNTDYKDLSKDLSDGKVVEKSKDEKDNLEDNLFDLIESMYDKDKDL